MIVDATQPDIRVSSHTRMASVGGATWLPRRNTITNRVCWYYEPRLLRGVEKAAPWCTADERQNKPLLATTPNTQLSDDLTGGIPCPKCNAHWSLT